MFGNMAGPHGSNELAPATHNYEIATLFIVIEMFSNFDANCTTIYNDTIIALFIDMILLAARWPWGRLNL
jgi:hypothetical protein